MLTVSNLLRQMPHTVQNVITHVWMVHLLLEEGRGVSDLQSRTEVS